MLEIKNQENINKLLLTATLIGSMIYIIAKGAGILFTSEELGPIIPGGNSTNLIIVDMLFLTVSLIGILILGRRNFSGYGFKKPEGNVPWGFIVGLGLVLGSIATITIILTGANGNPSLSGLDIRTKILLIWFLASITEEVFVRGFLQSYLKPLEERKIVLGKKFEISYPVIFSSLFFSAIHIPLIFFGADIISIVVICSLTLVLGYFAASLREKHESITPSIGIHVATNIGGTMLGPIIYALLIVG